MSDALWQDQIDNVLEEYRMNRMSRGIAFVSLRALGLAPDDADDNLHAVDDDG